MNKKKEALSEDRNEIVVNNFFKYLKERGISNSQYAKDNYIDKSLLTQWKNGSTKMTMENIYKASVYFDITVNDLMYDENEKKSIEVLSDKNYSPVKAQRHLLVEEYDYDGDYFNLSLNVIIILIAFAFVFFYRDNNAWIIGGITISILSSFFVSGFVLESKTSYIINYLDDIFYKIDNPKNEKRIFKYILNILVLLFIIIKYFAINNAFNKVNIQNFNDILLIISIAIDIILIAFNFYVSIYNKKELKKEVYYFEINIIGTVNIAFLLSVVNLFVLILMIAIYNLLFIDLLASTVVIPLFLLIYHILIHQKYKQYYLMYDENGVKQHKLFN